MVSKQVIQQDSSLWREAASPQGPAFNVFNLDLEKSQNDRQSYRLIRLQNELEAILVHDPDADKAAASLDVAVGHLSDPDDMPGLAHFCEHLLFMGTDQFPKENDYSEFISANGGSTNAFTGPSNTNYHFSVSTPHLEGALSRFATFFHSPLFKPSCTARELNAVDSEHKKNRQQDGWRLFQLGKGLSADGHKWRKFGSGNRESLLAAGRLVTKQQKASNATLNVVNGVSTNGHLDHPGLLTPRGPSPTPSTNSESELDGGAPGRETRRRLIEWWRSEYCAGRMKLAVVGKESLDELANMVTTLFSCIPNRRLEPLPLIQDSPLGPEQMGTVVFAKTVMDMNILEVAFALPYQYPMYRSKPANFLSHLIGHEGPGSIHSHLKKMGWLVSLEAGPSPLGRGFDAFRITINLTPEGIRNWRSVLIVLYKYISLLKASPLAPFHHSEIRTLSEIQFRFKEKRGPDDYVTSLSGLLQRPYQRQHLLNAPSLVWDWDEAGIRQVLDLLNVNTGRVMLMTRDHTGFGCDSHWLREKWYDTEYQVQRLPQSLVDGAMKPNDIPELFIPGPNPFIPENLNVEKNTLSVQPSQRPLLIRETPLSTLWHKKDDQFWVPKANIIIDILSPLASSTPHHAVMSRLLTELVADALTEYSYDAELAGLRYGFTNHYKGLQVTVMGYNDKIHVLLSKVLETLKTFRVIASRLAVIKHQLELEYRNFKLNPPYRIADYWLQYLLQEKAWTTDDLLAQLTAVTAAQLEEHSMRLLSKAYLDILVHGNVLKQDAINTATLVESTLQASPLNPTERPTERSLILHKGSNFVWPIEVPNEDDVNSSLSYYCHVGDVSDVKLRAILSLYAHIAREPCFDQLRTKEQLGYIVSSSSWHSTGSMGWRVVIQSERDPAYLESRVDAFLDSIKAKLESMTQTEFEGHRDGLIALKLEKPKNLAEERSRFWTHIQSGYQDFTRRLVDAEFLRGVTRNDVLDLLLTFIHPSSSQRRKLSVHCKSQIKFSTRFTVEAAEAFCVDLRDAGIAVDEEKFIELSTKEPPIEAVVAHWNLVLGQNNSISDADRKRLISRISQLAVDHAPDVDSNNDSSDGKSIPLAEVIEDGAAFKKTLILSPIAKPVQDYHDISTSRF